MRQLLNSLSKNIQAGIQDIDMDGCDISIEESEKKIKFLVNCMSDLRVHFLSIKNLTNQDEIFFFKEVKPEVLSFLVYFTQIRSIELRRPTGSNETLREYYNNELRLLTSFFERNLDFYQYYRSKSTHLDEYYFLRSKPFTNLCNEIVKYISDPIFSTGYDYQVATINSNEMLRIYLNKKKHCIEKQSIMDKNRTAFPFNNLKWSGSKIAAVELGYALQASKSINRGYADIKEIMNFIETCFNIDLGEYYRTYISMRERKKDRTPFLSSLIESLKRRMDEDDSR